MDKHFFNPSVVICGLSISIQERVLCLKTPKRKYSPRAKKRNGLVNIITCYCSFVAIQEESGSEHAGVISI